MATLTNIDPTFSADIGYGIGRIAFQADGTVLHSLLSVSSYRELAYPALTTSATHSMSPLAGVITMDGSGELFWMPQSATLTDVDVYQGIPAGHTTLTTVAWDEPSGYGIAYDQNNDLVYVLITGAVTPTPSPARLVEVTLGGAQTDVIPDGVIPAMDDTAQPVITPDGAVWGVTGSGSSRTVFRWDGTSYDTEVLTDPRPEFMLIPRPDNSCWFINVVDNLGWRIDASWNLSRVPLLDTVDFFDIQGVAWTPNCRLVVFEADFAWELTDRLRRWTVGRVRWPGTAGSTYSIDFDTGATYGVPEIIDPDDPALELLTLDSATEIGDQGGVDGSTYSYQAVALPAGTNVQGVAASLDFSPSIASGKVELVLRIIDVGASTVVYEHVGTATSGGTVNVSGPAFAVTADSLLAVYVVNESGDDITVDGGQLTFTWT